MVLKILPEDPKMQAELLLNVAITSQMLPTIIGRDIPCNPIVLNYQFGLRNGLIQSLKMV